MLATWGCTTFPKPTLSLDFLGATSLDSGITFSRGSQATLFDSTGTLVYAKHNLLLQSQDFTTTWGNTRSTDVADTDTAPDGTVTADSLLQESGQTVAGNVSQTASVQLFDYVISVFAKPNGKNFLRIVETLQTGSTVVTFFDVQNGTIGTTGSGHTATITASTNGYYRCSVKFTANAARSGSVFLGLADSNNSVVVVDSGGLYLWGAQFNLANMEGGVTSSLTTYYPTTTAAYYAPRFDYNPSTLQPRGLLIEEQRSNILINSEVFSASSGSVVTNNAAISPTGGNTATTFVEDSSSGLHAAQSSSATLSAVSTTISVYAKANGRNWIAIRTQSITRAFFDISNGTIGTVDASATASITNAGNGWYRCVVTITPTAGAANIFIRLATANNVDSYTGDGTSGVFIFGMQIEAGAFATSYIPTTTTALTRNADVASMTGTNFSSWYNQAEGSFFCQAQGQGGTYINADNNTSNERNVLYFSTATVPAYFVSSGGATSCNLNAGTIVANSLNKIIGAYKVNDFAVSLNGAAAVTDATGAVPAPDRFRIGRNAADTSFINGWIARIAYYPTRLPNTTLQALTA